MAHAEDKPTWEVRLTEFGFLVVRERPIGVRTEWDRSEVYEGPEANYRGHLFTSRYRAGQVAERLNGEVAS